MDMKIPLKMLRFGHEDGEGINARVAGRDDGIAALAANLNANGQIENLIVKEIDGGCFAVANGNRRLAAFRMIYGDNSDQPIGCTLHQVNTDKAFEFSLATAITAEQLHPVDQYEAFAKLKERGQTEEEIAQHYGMSAKRIRQRLALGTLSVNVRNAWRGGEIDEEAAEAFTLAVDHAHQDKVLEKMRAENAERDWGDNKIEADQIEDELKVDPNNVGYLLRFVGIEAYEAKKGKIVTRDLFGHRHKVSDEKLLKKLADDKLEDACKLLKNDGWSFAAVGRPSNYWDYGETKIEPTPTPAEQARIDTLAAIVGDDDRSMMVSDMTADQARAHAELQEIEKGIHDRSYTPEMRAKSGCWVSIDHNGELEIKYGKIKPKEKAAAAAVERTKRKKVAANQAAAEGKPAAESKVVSNALLQRLEAQLIAATRDGIAGDPLLAESPFADVMAKTICSMITPDRVFSMPDGVRTKLPSIRQALDENVFNAAVGKRFDAKDYFSNAPKPLVLKAITEAINADEARKISSKTKADIWKWALDNLAKTGWLPKELRTVHYKGPGSEGYKKPADAPAKPHQVPAAMSDALTKAERALKPLKRAAAVRKAAKAATKKTAKKTTAKKRKAA